MNRKISIGLAIAIAALAAAISFFAGSSIVRDKINDTLIDLSEKQAMYSKLAEIDSCIRTNIDEEINEEALMEGICRGYIEGLNKSGVAYMTADEYSSKSIVSGNGVKIIKLSDGSAILISGISETSGGQ